MYHLAAKRIGSLTFKKANDANGSTKGEEKEKL